MFKCSVTQIRNVSFNRPTSSSSWTLRIPQDHVCARSVYHNLVVRIIRSALPLPFIDQSSLLMIMKECVFFKFSFYIRQCRHISKWVLVWMDTSSEYDGEKVHKSSHSVSTNFPVIIMTRSSTNACSKTFVSCRNHRKVPLSKAIA